MSIRGPNKLTQLEWLKSSYSSLGYFKRPLFNAIGCRCTTTTGLRSYHRPLQQQSSKNTSKYTGHLKVTQNTSKHPSYDSSWQNWPKTSTRPQMTQLLQPRSTKWLKRDIRESGISRRATDRLASAGVSHNCRSNSLENCNRANWSLRLTKALSLAWAPVPIGR